MGGFEVTAGQGELQVVSSGECFGHLSAPHALTEMKLLGIGGRAATRNRQSKKSNTPHQPGNHGRVGNDVANGGWKHQPVPWPRLCG